MHLGFVLGLSDIDLQDMDLSDTDFLLDKDVASKHFAGLQDVFKISSRRRQRNNFFVFQDVFKTSSRRLPRKILMLKTCWRRL